MIWNDNTISRAVTISDVQIAAHGDFTDATNQQKFNEKLGDNCIQNIYLGRYIVGYTVGNLVLRRCASGAVNMISERKSDDIPPQMKILNMVIPILMHFCSFVANGRVASSIMPHVIQ